VLAELRDYTAYTQSLRIAPLSDVPVWPSLETTHYTSLLNTVPLAAQTVPVVLDCMLLHVERRLAQEEAARPAQSTLEEEPTNTSREASASDKTATKRKAKSARPLATTGTAEADSVPAGEETNGSGGALREFIAREMAKLLVPEAAGIISGFDDEGIARDSDEGESCTHQLPLWLFGPPLPGFPAPVPLPHPHSG
jgi:hypothetical protein